MTLMCVSCRARPAVSGEYCGSCAATPGPTTSTTHLSDAGALATAGDIGATFESYRLPVSETVPAADEHDLEETRLGPSGLASMPKVAQEPAGPLADGQAFGGRYHIVRLLGLGGMGAVYQAWDAELAVVVALKLTRPEIASDPEGAQLVERRFKQELLLARKVTHKNVVRIHDLGEVNGIKYITMPYIEGEDLASVLAREGTLPLPRVLSIARSLVSGLAAAHAAGVIHRDLKPANIMIGADGEALITDFGIARSAGGVRQTGAGAMPGYGGAAEAVADYTVVGAVVGTIAYMAPEQAQARPVDHRADIYAAGLILHDMLAGRARFERAESAIAELTSRTLAAPPPLRAANPAIPESIDRVVTRCLQPDPAARYQTTAELVADLDRIDDTGKVARPRRHVTGRLIAGVAAVFIALLTLTWWFSSGAAPPVDPAPLSVLIADFENQTGEAVFSGAVEQALSITMEGASFVSAYPRPKARQVAAQLRSGAPLDAAMAELVARREALNVVLAGTITRDGSRYVISARALDVRQPSSPAPQLASAKVTARDRDDVLAAIGRLAGTLRQRLGDRAVSRAAAAPSDTFTAASLEAMRAYVRGQDLQVAGRFDEALAAYQEAVSLDEGFGRAHAGMGVIYGNLKQQAKAEESYQRALRHLDRMTEREKYSTLGGYYLLVSRDYEQAVKNYEALVSRFPADRGGHANLAYAYLNRHEMDKALVEVRKALDLEPGNVLQRMNYAMYALYAGDFATAMAESKKIPATSGLYPYALLTEGRAAAAAGDPAAGRDAFSRLAALGPDGAALAAIARADLAMYEGRYAAAIDLLRAPPAGTPSDPANTATRAMMIAEAHYALGRKKEAAAAVAQAFAASRQEETLVPAALLLTELGDTAAVDAIARDLENRLQPESRAYARLVAGSRALRAGRLPAALDALRQGTESVDGWFLHLQLGRTYLAAGRAPEALAEFEACLKRQGEATDLFFANGATLRYLAPVRYWLARAQEALGNAGATQNYQWYVTLRAATDAEDPLLEDARARLKR
jgi:serine/threonine protein kinase/tetratricopeptide (TPR) repeat protein